MNTKEYERLLENGLERPVVETPRIRVNTPPRPVNDPHSAEYLPRKYLETLEYNQKINGCCRRPEESGHTAQWFATPTAEVKEDHIVPDILVIECGACGRNHTRFMVGGGDRRHVIREVR